MKYTKIKYEPIAKNGSWNLGGHALTTLFDHKRSMELRVFGETLEEAKNKIMDSLIGSELGEQEDLLAQEAIAAFNEYSKDKLNLGLKNKFIDSMNKLNEACADEPSPSPGKTEEEWKVFNRITPLGDTGDNLVSEGITNGELELLDHFEKSDGLELQEICDKLNSAQRSIKWPSVEDAGIIAVGLSDNLTAQEQSFFVAGFQECIKYLTLMREGVK